MSQGERCKNCGDRIVWIARESGSWWTHQPASAAGTTEFTHADCWTTRAEPREA